MMVLDEVFQRCLHHESGALLHGIHALIKETPQSSLGPGTMQEQSKKAPVRNQKESSPQRTQSGCYLALGLPAPRTGTYKFLLFRSYPAVCGVSL